MLSEQKNQSEVARLLWQIGQEYQSGQNALYGFASGNARHDFIDSKMKRVGELHTQLQGIVGDQAIGMIFETINQLP